MLEKIVAFAGKGTTNKIKSLNPLYFLQEMAY